MASGGRIGGLVSLNLLLPIIILIFASGFFPYKPFIPGLADFEATPYSDHQPPAPFNKLVFMVVDALRSDFVYGHGSGFTYTQSLIRDGAAIPFTAHATAPTVTMPRVKAITTGSIPSFLDMILNFAESDKTSSLATQDTWLAQMKRKPDANLLMYGDDTWLKLFPDTFSRADGTSSFFVSDFTEVDNNVTRHVPGELGREDWNVMIMHYLGMDHIGHKAGPKSINMLPKQQEMDGIVQQIFTAMSTKPHLQDTLLVLCGDHGMTDGGNHGGSAPGETSPALAFLSPRLRQRRNRRTYESPTTARDDFEFYTTVEQSDIAPTLAGLLGFPVSLNNLGIFIPESLELWPESRDRAQLMLRNAMQMLGIAKATFPHAAYEDASVSLNCTRPEGTADALACAWKGLELASRSTLEAKVKDGMILHRALEFCKLAQKSLSSTASNYNLTRLYAGLALAVAVTGILVILSWALITSSFSGVFFTAAAVAYAGMMLASSYVEEEQQYIYWITSAWLMTRFMIVFRDRRDWLSAGGFCALLIFRILRRWNQSGQKHQGSHDIATAASNHPYILLWPLILLTIQTIFNDLSASTFYSLSKLKSRAASAILVNNCLLFKLAYILQQDPELLGPLPDYAPWLATLDPTLLARLQFLLLAAATMYLLQQRLGTRSAKTASTADPPTLRDSIAPLLTLLLVTQSRPANIPPFLLFLALAYFLRHLMAASPTSAPTTTTTAAMTQLLLARSSFFALGGTNGISSIDLSNAYNGVKAYNPALVGLLLVLSNWSGPVFWALAPQVRRVETARSRMSRFGVRSGDHSAAGAGAAERDAAAKHGERSKRVQVWYEESLLLTLWTSVEVLGVCLACVVHRQHLFVWTVFSPRFLYMAAWVVCWHLGCNVVIAGVLAWVG